MSAPPPKKQRSDETGRVNVQPQASMPRTREMDQASTGSNSNATGTANGSGSHPAPADHIDDALTRRRKQLQELRRQQQKSDLLTKARSQLSSNAASLPPSSIGHGPPLRSSLKPHQNVTLNPPVSVGNGALPTPSKSLQMPMPMPPPSIPRQYVDDPSMSSMPPTAPVPPIAIPSHSVVPSPASPEIVRRLNFAPSAPLSSGNDKSSIDTNTEASSSLQPRTEVAPPLVPEARPFPSEISPTVATTAVPKERLPSFAATTSSSPRNSRPVRPPPITPSFGGDTSITKTSAHPPSTTNGTIEPGPPASRQAFLSSMYEAADSPATAAKRNSELKLIRELKQVHQEKEDAFRQVVRLREQIQKLQKHHDFESQKERTAQELQHLVEIADRNGDRAALKWAREQATATKSTTKGPFSKTPLSGHGRAASPSRRAMTGAIGPGVRKRVSTPHPKRVNSDTSNGEESKLLAKATETNPDEFDSDVATYHVRRPYVLSANDDFWNEVGELSNEEYQATADVGKPASLEIAAKIKVDGSILLLSGLCTVRHKKPRSTKWKIFEDVDDMDKPLGSVMFIDGQANEGEYWLDEIYEEAMSTRDTYCSSLLATASALKSTLQASPVPSNFMLAHSDISPGAPLSSPMQHLSPMQYASLPPHSFPTQQHNSQLTTPPVVLKESVGETATLQSPVEVVQPQDPTLQPTPELSKVKVESIPALPVERKSEGSAKIDEKMAQPPEEADAASDILSNLLGFFFLCIFQVCYFCLVKLPIRITVATTVASVVGAILSILWLFLANDNGAGELGANLGYGFNRPGIQ